MCLLTPLLGAEEVRITALSKQNPELKFEIKPEADFSQRLLDALKSGQKLIVKYHILVKEEAFWPATLAEADIQKTISYDHKTQTYTLTSADTETLLDEKTFIFMLHTPPSIPLQLLEELAPGNEVKVYITMTYKEEGVEEGLLYAISFQDLWRTQKFTWEGSYLVH